MRELFRSFRVIGLVMLIPIIPFLFFGEQMEAWVENWKDQPPAALLVVGLLATDIFLPIPSSVVNTMAGYHLGVLWGALACWAGMTIGAALGFALARRWGRSFALWFTQEEDLDRMHWLCQKYGPSVLLLARGAPVLAEASVLLMGVHGLSWKRFLPPVMFGNLVLAYAYAQFGKYAEENHWFYLALAVSILLPVLLAAVAQWWLKRNAEPDPS